MGFTDSKMSDLNFLPKKHTNFSIENILLKQKSDSSAGRTFEIEQKVDLTVKTCIKYEQDDLKVATAPSPSTSSTLQQTRPLNRVLANPWCSRGPLMFDPKMMISGAKATTTATAAPASVATATSSLVGAPQQLIKTEVERKVVLSAYANSSVIERNRLSINYPYPVGFFNAYAAAASIATHHHQQHLNHHHLHHQHRLEQQSVTVPTVLNSFHLEKSDENQNSIFPLTTSLSNGSNSNSSHGSYPSDSTPASNPQHPFFGLESEDLLSYGELRSPNGAGSSPVGGAATAFGSLVGLPEFSFQCQMCDKIFGSQDTLLLHEKTHKSPRFECEECGKGFSQLRNYKYHISVHRGTKEFAAKCPECGKVFNDKGYLSSHLKIHRNKKEYACPHCPKSFNQRVAFNMHVRIHTGVKPHKCNECGKRFSRKMLLKQHLRTHSGEKPYQCSVCGKSFADRSNMTLHHRLHSGVKPFACPVCPKAFTKKHHLKTHINYHTGHKPYTCPHANCGQTFTQSSNMRTHAKKCQFKPPEQA
ncbi:zinc finger protein 41 [Culex pipiens pallens]|uniref:zinc finger protein 41 n=1 Tax=Culex pipiens pallens TaxID=42434 RepID=UPI001952BDE5|nr:zinc finger protein 41 [Culex pipiens pallens]